MTPHSLTRRRLLAAAAFAFAPRLAGAADPKPDAKLITLAGKVVPLADLVKKAGGKLDADAAPTSLALLTADDKVYPLVKDDGSRLFFKDRRLLNRPMRLTGKLVPGGQLFMARSVRSVGKGEVYEVFYWCDVCSIKRGEMMACECCGAPMDLKEEPVKR